MGSGIKVGAGAWAWAIASTCPHPEEAWRFVAQLMSPKVILLVSKANGGIPGRRSLLARAPLYGAHGPLRVFAQQLDAGFVVLRPTTPAYGTISDAFFKAVRGVVAGGDPQAQLMDGLEAMRQIHATAGLESVPVFVLSASAGPEERARSRVAGAARFFPKPLDHDGLLQAIGEQLQLQWTHL